MRNAIALKGILAFGVLLMASAAPMAQATSSTTSTTTPLVTTVGSSCAPELIDITLRLHPDDQPGVQPPRRPRAREYDDRNDSCDQQRQKRRFSTARGAPHNDQP
jgi:hypothetical protein